MKGKRFTDEQITHALRQAEGDTPVVDVCHPMDVSEASLYLWKRIRKHGMTEVREMRQLGDEKARLKRLVADLTLDKHILGEVVRKSSEASAPSRAGRMDAEQYGVSIRKAIRFAQFSYGGWYPKKTARDQSVLRLRIREVAHARPQFGYVRIDVMLRREGWPVNKKRVYRWYRHEGPQIRMRVRLRKHMCMHRGPVPQARRTHERRSMDFIHNQLFNGRPFRVLTVVDQFSRQTALLEPRFSFLGRDVVAALDRGWQRSFAHLEHDQQHGARGYTSLVPPGRSGAGGLVGADLCGRTLPELRRGRESNGRADRQAGRRRLLSALMERH